MISGKDSLDTSTTDPLDPGDVVAWWVDRARESGFVVVTWQVRLLRDVISGRRAGS